MGSTRHCNEESHPAHYEQRRQSEELPQRHPQLAVVNEGHNKMNDCKEVEEDGEAAKGPVEVQRQCREVVNRLVRPIAEAQSEVQRHRGK